MEKFNETPIAGSVMVLLNLPLFFLYPTICLNTLLTPVVVFTFASRTF